MSERGLEINFDELPPTPPDLEEIGPVVAAYLRENPEATVQQLAELVDTEPFFISQLLNSYTPTADGVEQVGEGQGHGWATIPDPPPMEGEHIGYRWPDGELRDEPFDITNAEHLAIMEQ